MKYKSSLTPTIGYISGISHTGGMLVDFRLPENEEYSCISAISVSPFNSEDIGKRVLIIFKDNDKTKPVVIRVISAKAESPRLKVDEESSQYPARSFFYEGKALYSESIESKEKAPIIEDNEIVIEAKALLSIKSDNACIQLKYDGTITFDGNYILCRASSVNQISGSAIEIN